MRGVYIHIPFCLKKCNYCNFTSYKMNINNAENYLSALECEIKNTYKGDTVNTLYIGGGTPTALDEKLLEKLLKCVKNNIHISNDCEITVEINPKTLTKEKCDIMKQYGVNRVSLGVQSLSDDELEFLGRIHNAYDTECTYNMLREKGFNNISFDLMFGIPRSNKETLKQNLNKYISLNPEHISCYGLSAEHGTVYGSAVESKKIRELCDDEFAEMYDIIRKYLNGGGYSQYEISNFSKTGFESKHNMKYWTQGEYYGFGVSAAGFLNGERYTNTEKIAAYTQNVLKGKPSDKSESYSMTKAEQMSEFVVLGLRLTKIGADKKAFYEKFGIDTEAVFGDVIEKYVKLGFLDSTCERILLKPNAYYVSNSILCEFMT